MNNGKISAKKKTQASAVRTLKPGHLLVNILMEFQRNVFYMLCYIIVIRSLMLYVMLYDCYQTSDFICYVI